MFAAGFVLGLVRVLLLAGLVGEVEAVLIELPVILGFAWWVCGAVIGTTRLPADLGPRLVMGASALVVLLLFELAAAVILFDAGLAGWVRRWSTWAGFAGLLGQVAFASFPVLRLVGSQRRG